MIVGLLKTGRVKVVKDLLTKKEFVIKGDGPENEIINSTDLEYLKEDNDVFPKLFENNNIDTNPRVEIKSKVKKVFNRIFKKKKKN